MIRRWGAYWAMCALLGLNVGFAIGNAMVGDAVMVAFNGLTAVGLGYVMFVMEGRHG